MWHNGLKKEKPQYSVFSYQNFNPLLYNAKFISEIKNANFLHFNNSTLFNENVFISPQSHEFLITKTSNKNSTYAALKYQWKKKVVGCVCCETKRQTSSVMQELKTHEGKGTQKKEGKYLTTFDDGRGRKMFPTLQQLAIRFGESEASEHSWKRHWDEKKKFTLKL